MPDPNVSNRERLLRLIDGGPEVLREAQVERESAEEKKPATPSVVITPVVESNKQPVMSPAGKSDVSFKVDIRMVASAVLVLAVIGVAAFYFFHKTSKSTVVPKEAVTVATAPNAAKAPEEEGPGLRLVGVDWGDAPVALLEDLHSGKTYFARKNDTIKGARVKQILKDRVLVTYHSKNMELR